MKILLALAALAALAVPAGALATRTMPGDGTLSVRSGDGIVVLDLARGAVIGRIAKGTVTVVDPKGGDCDAPLVWDNGERAEAVERSMLGELGQREPACVFTGTNMRFRLVGGKNHVILSGTDISVSAVGRGFVLLRGTRRVQDGSYSLNGEPYESMPDQSLQLTLGSAGG